MPNCFLALASSFVAPKNITSINATKSSSSSLAMASSSSLKPIIASLLILSVLLHSDQVVAEAAAVGYSQVQKMGIGCGGACAARCRLSKRPNLCKRACGTCCARCGCVPPGTSGNLDACPCYASITTRGNKPKCP